MTLRRQAPPDGAQVRPRPAPPAAALTPPGENWVNPAVPAVESAVNPEMVR